MLDRVLGLPARLLTNPRFVRFAERFPLTRPIARREARALFDIGAGFVYAQVLLACVRLRLFEELAHGPLTEAKLCERLKLEPYAARRLLTASSALRLTQRCSGDRWALARLGAACLSSPGLSQMVEHHVILYRDLADPVPLLRRQGKTELSDYWPYADEDTRTACEEYAVSNYTRLMSATMPAIAEEILDAVPFRRYRRLLDLGGGDGTFLAKAAERMPHLELMLFELPDVAKLARVRFEEARISLRARIFEGDLKRSALPADADIITLIRILLDHDDEAALKILHNARRALSPGAALVVAEPMAETKGAESVGAYFAFYLMAMGGGRPRSKAELTGLLKEAGFASVKELPACQPLLTRILLAR